MGLVRSGRGRRPGSSGDASPSDRANGMRGIAGKELSTRNMVLSMAAEKVTVTIPEELLEEIRADAAERGLSAYAAEAARFERDRDRLLELVNWLGAEYGAITDDERATAMAEMDELDAEHERRRAGGKRGDAGEAA